MQAVTHRPARGRTQGTYGALVLEHFEHPRNAGRYRPQADVIEGAAGRPAQGAAFVLSARIEDERLGAVRFEAYGCPHCIAAASWLSERLRGATRADLDAWRWTEAADRLEVPAEKWGRMLVLEDAVHELARAWERLGEAAAPE